MGSPPQPLKHGDYTVACICPMGVELAAVECMLDDSYPHLPSSRDTMSYIPGRIGEHFIVIAVMPETGNNRAAAVATQLLNDFPSIRFGLLVGIGGGVPSEAHDIRLGDVIISKPTDTFGGVVQYDRGKQTAGPQFVRTGSLTKPPSLLLITMGHLESKHRKEGSKISVYLSDMLKKWPNMEEEEYTHQGVEKDDLYEASYNHNGGATCKNCDKDKLVDRGGPRKNDKPKVFYGTIGSGNMVIRDGTTREQLQHDLGILCVEMEAAGLMDEFQCLVIRGICDYADSHKNKRWQPYAAATAAAYMKELLLMIPAAQVTEIERAADKMGKRSVEISFKATS